MEDNNRKSIILFIDDKQFAHTLIDLMNLDLLEYKVVHAYSAKEGLELARKYASSLFLVLCDIMLIDMHGYEMHDIFVKDKDLSTVPFVFQSGLPIKEIDLRNASVQILHKPYNQSDLMEIISKI